VATSTAADGSLVLYNFTGTTHVVVDVQGYFH
jgi:hypothetical protein